MNYKVSAEKMNLELDIEAIEEEHNFRASKQTDKSPATAGNKTPQVPGLDLNKLNNKKRKETEMKFPGEKENPYL